MNNDYDKKLLYAIHHKERYDLDERHVTEYAEFLKLRQLLADSHGELLVNEFLQDQEDEMQTRLSEEQIDLENKQQQQWSYYHGIDDPKLLKRPEILFQPDLNEKQSVPEREQMDVNKSDHSAEHVSMSDNLTSVAKKEENTINQRAATILSSQKRHESILQKDLENPSQEAKDKYQQDRTQQRQNRILEELYKLRDKNERQAFQRNEKEQ